MSGVEMLFFWKKGVASRTTTLSGGRFMLGVSHYLSRWRKDEHCH